MSSPSLPPLFSPLTLGALQASHRVVLPAMQRQLAQAHGVPGAAMAAHYAERTTRGGLLVTETAWTDAVGHADGREPGIYNPEQVNAWRQVTDAVHARGSLVVCQLGFAMAGDTATRDVDGSLRQLRDAAECAGDAGFDGVELLGMPVQGGGARLLPDLLHTLAGVWEPGRIGLRLSAVTPALRQRDAVALPSLLTAVATAQGACLAYVHLGPGWPEDHGFTPEALLDCLTALRDASPPARTGVLIASGGFTAASAHQVLAAGLADAVAFGRPFLANADLPHRLRYGAPLGEAVAEVRAGNISASATSPTALRCDADPWHPDLR